MSNIYLVYDVLKGPPLMPSFPSSYPFRVTAYTTEQAEKKALREETADSAAGIIAVHQKYEEKKKASYFAEEMKRNSRSLWRI